MFSLLYILRTSPKQYSEVTEHSYHAADDRLQMMIGALGFIIGIVIAFAVGAGTVVGAIIVATLTFLPPVATYEMFANLRMRAWHRMLQQRLG